MKKITRIKKVLSTLAVGVLTASFLAIAPLKASALTIPYQGATTPNAPSPAFNVYSGTPNDGDEQDFLRGKVTGDPAPSTNAVSTACEDGTRFTLRVYVHNGASEKHNDGGNGPSVAKGTTVKVGNVTNVTGSNFAPNATISATNAGSVSDGMTITCSNGAQVTMNYVKGTAQQYTIPGGNQALSDNIVTTGAPIGTVKPDGNVWGCWDQRVWVTLIVEVKKKPTPPPVSRGECKVLEVAPVPNKKRTVKANLSGITENAQIIGYEINWGEEGVAPSNKAQDEHTYAKDGEYTIVGKVLVKLANGQEVWRTATDCAKKVTFSPDTPDVPVTPVTPPEVPTVLPATGPGDIAAIFAAISIAGGVAYRVYMARRLGA